MAELTREYLLNIKNLFQECQLATMCELALKGLEAKKLTEQRDALLVALKRIANLWGGETDESYANDQPDDAVEEMCKQARAAIAAVEAK